MISVYISSGKIQIAYGKRTNNILQVSFVNELPLLSGCITDGKIIEPKQIVSLLKGLSLPKNSKVNILLDHDLTALKRLNTPNLRSDIIIKLISESYPHSGGSFFDYRVLDRNSDGSLDILACKAEDKVISEYIEVFSEAGVKIGRIEPNICAAIRLAENCEMLKASTFVLVAAEKESITYCLFSDGKYRLSGKERIVNNDQRTDSIIAAFPDTVKLGVSTSAVLYSGLTERELDELRVKTADMNIKTALFPEQKEISFKNGERLCDSIFVVGGLL